MTNSIAIFLEKFPNFTLPIISKLITILIVFIITTTVIKAITPLIHDLCKKNDVDQHTCHMLRKIIRYILSILGATIALQNIGVEVSMLITAFGVTGIVLSYGMKDIVANFIAGILIMGYKHIKINDLVKVGQWQGTVIDINLRYTTLQSQEATIYIPNIVIYTEPIAVISKK